jgi:hypothetical protein
MTLLTTTPQHFPRLKFQVFWQHWIVCGAVLVPEFPGGHAASLKAAHTITRQIIFRLAAMSTFE